MSPIPGRIAFVAAFFTALRFDLATGCILFLSLAAICAAIQARE